jgi:hypothetical protein
VLLLACRAALVQEFAGLLPKTITGNRPFTCAGGQLRRMRLAFFG